MPTPITSTARTTWTGDLFSGSGTTRLASSGAGTFAVTWKARAEEHGGLTSPEELVAAAHATCFSQQLSLDLTQNGTPPTRIETGAEVTFVVGSGITGIHLTVEAEVPGVSAEDFTAVAEGAKAGCPVSQALAATPVSLTAQLA